MIHLLLVTVVMIIYLYHYLQVFANREDRVSKSSKVAYDDQDVERVRR